MLVKGASIHRRLSIHRPERNLLCKTQHEEPTSQLQPYELAEFNLSLLREA